MSLIFAIPCGNFCGCAFVIAFEFNNSAFLRRYGNIVVKEDDRLVRQAVELRFDIDCNA
jgi:hypothetical protein